MASSSSSAFRELQRDLENHANALSKIQKDIAKNHQVRKQYTIQLGENELVLKELELLKEDANVYKLIGPVLVKQDLAEANANVRKRMEYITAELKRLDGTLQDLEDQQNSKRETTAEGARLARRDLLPLFLGNKYMKDHFPAVAHVAMEINEAWREQHPKGRGARNVRQKSAKPQKDKEVASKNSITGPQKNKEVATKSSSGSKRAAAKKTLPAYSWWEDLKTACNLNKERQLYMPVPEGEFVGNAFRAWKQHVINAVGCAGPIELISRLETTSVPYEIYTVAKEAAQKIGIKWENLVTKPAILPDIVEGGTTTLSSDSSSGLPLGFEHTPRKRGRSSESEGAPSSSRPRTEVPNAADEATSAMPERDAGICFSPYIDAITGDATIPSGDASPNNMVVSPEAHFSPDVLDTPLNSPRLVTENDMPFGGGEEVPIQDEARETPENGFAEDVLEEGLDPPFENIPEGFNILAGVLPQVPSSNCSSEHLGEEGEILSETLVPQIPSELSVCVVSSTSTDVAPVAAGDGAQRSPSAEDVVPQEGVAEDISPARLLPTEGTQPSIQEAGTSQLPTDESVEPPPSTIIADHNNAADALKMDFQSTVHATFNEEIANIANSESAKIIPAGIVDFPAHSIEWPTGIQVTVVAPMLGLLTPFLADVDGFFARDPPPSFEEARVLLEQSTRGWHNLGFPQDVWMAKMNSLWDELGHQHLNTMLKRQFEEELQVVETDLQKLQTSRTDIHARVHELRQELEAFNEKLKEVDQTILEKETRAADLRNNLTEH